MVLFNTFHENIYFINQNEACDAVSNSTLRGTCFSASECTAMGGSADGNCASGFGVCCRFILTGCGGTVNKVKQTKLN